MLEKNIEKELAGVDFSRFSKVKGRLFNRLMDLESSRMAYNDLDMVVAAGTGATGKKSDHPGTETRG